MISMSIGLASVMSPVSTRTPFEDLLGCDVRSQSAQHGRRQREMPSVARPRIPGPGRGKTIVVTFCFSSASELEWNQEKLKKYVA